MLSMVSQLMLTYLLYFHKEENLQISNIVTLFLKSSSQHDFGSPTEVYLHSGETDYLPTKHLVFC